MKKLLSLFLAAVLACTSLSALTAFADEAAEVEIEFSVYDGGTFTMTPEILDVSADEDNAYAGAIGYNDDDSNVTVLDAVIAAHIEKYGSDFMDSAPIQYSNGMLVKSFGKETSALIFRVNGAMQAPDGSYYNLDSALNDGDSVEYMFYQDAFYGDKYTRFDQRHIEVPAGKSFTLTLTVETYDESWSPVVLPAAGFNVYLESGKLAGTTDENGKVSLKFNNEGTYGVYPKGVYSDGSNTYEIFAAYCTIEVKNTLLDYVTEQVNNACDYLSSSKTSYELGDSYDLALFLKVGYDLSDYADAYAQSVKANLDANGGKIMVEKSVYNETTGATETVLKEDLGLYGAVICNLDAFGYDYSDFYGYNIYDAFESADIEDARPHQYYYEYAILISDEERAKAIIDDLIANYYTLGKGLNNWGYSCDNTCHFLTAISPYAQYYADYVKDAYDVIAGYMKENGAYCDNTWVTEPNADSTALTLAAVSSVKNTAYAYDVYKLLVENYEGETAGIFTLDGKDNAYATKDVLYSLFYFLNIIDSANLIEKEHVYKYEGAVAATCTKEGSETYTCALCGENKTVSIEKLPHTVIKDRAVAPTFKKEGKTAGSHCSVCGTILTAQKAVKKLGKAKLKKLKKGKRAITVKWRKVKGVDGYQIQYSLKKSFKKKKTVNVKKAKTVKRKIKKLKSNKKYYVRIRAYKVINGKKEFSAWSKVKAVKTK